MKKGFEFIKIYDEEYRFFHTHATLKITLKDIIKMLSGKRIRIAICYRLKIHTEDKQFKDFEVDTISTRTLIVDKTSVVRTKKAKFSYDDLHNNNSIKEDIKK